MGRASETRPGGLKGKIQYMAPEQAAAGQVDRRSDVFSLGVVLWEAICGRRPFRRETDLETLRAIAEEAIPPPSRFVRISARLEGIVMRALEKNPADRFQTAQEMALALERFAFATQEFNPVQIAVTMKGLFAADFARWRRTVSAAKDLEGEPEQWVNTSGTYLRPEAIDLKTRGSTVALHRVPSPPPALNSTQELVSDSRSAASGELSWPYRPPPRHTRLRWALLAGLSVLVAAGAGVGVMTWLNPRETHTLVGRVVGHAMSSNIQAQVEALPHVAEARPVVAPTLTASQAHLIQADPPPPIAQTEPAAAERTAVPAPQDVGTAASPAQAETRARTPVYDPWDGRPLAVRPGALPVAKGPHRYAVPVRATNQRPARGAACSMRVGTRPWAEIWIDGRNTFRHTPYSEHIDCGPHKLTFKRPDLHLVRSFAILVSPGEISKQSFSLRDD